MEQIRNEIAVLETKMKECRVGSLFNDSYDWYEIDVPVEDREHYKEFYRKFCNSLAEIKNRKCDIYGEHLVEKIRLLKNDFEPHGRQRYFDPKMFPSGSIVVCSSACFTLDEGLPYVITKARKTYLEGYFICGNHTGEVKRITTKPRLVQYIKKLYKN
jgi:hypothetical protein